MDIIITYSIYLVLSALLVVVVGYLFYRSGDAYITFLFPDDKQLGENLNKLLLLGYYLLNIGFILFFLQKINSLNDFNSSVNFIIGHLSNNMLTIALMHYINLLWLKLLANKYFIHHKKQ